MDDEAYVDGLYLASILARHGGEAKTEAALALLPPAVRAAFARRAERSSADRSAIAARIAARLRGHVAIEAIAHPRAAAVLASRTPERSTARGLPLAVRRGYSPPAGLVAAIREGALERATASAHHPETGDRRRG